MEKKIMWLFIFVGVQLIKMWSFTRWPFIWAFSRPFTLVAVHWFHGVQRFRWYFSDENRFLVLFFCEFGTWFLPKSIRFNRAPAIIEPPIIEPHCWKITELMLYSLIYGIPFIILTSREAKILAYWYLPLGIVSTCSKLMYAICI